MHRLPAVCRELQEFWGKRSKRRNEMIDISIRNMDYRPNRPSFRAFWMEAMEVASQNGLESIPYRPFGGHGLSSDSPDGEIHADLSDGAEFRAWRLLPHNVVSIKVSRCEVRDRGRYGKSVREYEDDELQRRYGAAFQQAAQTRPELEVKVH
jgi:hypothetical protein